MREELYLGIDGGQSHTEAVIADREGHILGRGSGGPSNHAEQPGGRERLRRAVIESVGSALKRGGVEPAIGDTVFAAAHCAMTGGAQFKEEVISAILRARYLKVGHDAPAALAGATGGEPGLVVIAGTGSVAYGEKASGESLQVGGWGHLFGDEGSAFWISLQAVRRAMRADDGLAEPTGLAKLALDYFNCSNLRALALSVYGEEITRDRFATFAAQVHEAALAGDRKAREIVNEAGRSLAMLAATTARRLRMTVEEARTAYVGGVFRSSLIREAFINTLSEQWPVGRVIAPRFDPATGALLLAYRAAGCEISESLLANLQQETMASGPKEAMWQ